MMSLIKEIIEVRNYFSAAKDAPDITFYSEAGIYFQYFEGTINAILNQSELQILYIASDPQDPIFKRKIKGIKVFYINKLIPFVFPFIKTKALVMTMTDLNRYHVKRSTNSVNHIYMFHAINSVHLQYNQGAFDYYDTIFCIGPHHVEEIRKGEDLYRLPKKELLEVGYSWLEKIEQENRYSTPKKNKILIAPTWSVGNILESCIEPILEKLLPLDYEVIVRPHPEFIKRQVSKVNYLQKKYEIFTNLLFDNESHSSTHIFDSSILITDWSGIAMEYSWGMFKPVIYIDTPKKIHNLEFEKIGIIPLEDKIRKLNGTVIKISDCHTIDSVVEKDILLKDKNKKKLMDLRKKHIFNWGQSSNIAAKYIIDYCKSN